MARLMGLWVLGLSLVVMSGCEVGDTVGDDDDDDDDLVGVAVHSITSGDLAPLPDFAAEPVAGRAQLVRHVDDTTVVSVSVTGVAALTEHDAHVHAFPCEFLGGGHYKMDPTIDDTVEANEIWPSFTADEDGVGQAAATAQHAARGDALSVVVHDPVTGDKMACADLLAGDVVAVTATGSFAPFAAAEGPDMTIGGTATLVRGSNGVTQLDVSLTGLVQGTEYKSHVHALPCDVNNAGGHYKLDPTIDVADELNELWPMIVVQPDGTATDTLTSNAHLARADAQSVVVHRVVAIDDAPKVACVDLVRDSYPTLDTAGTAVLLEEGMLRGYDALAATAEMTRAMSGDTTVTLSVTGVTPNTEYPAHVHNLPCGVNSGGGHYKIDTSVADTVESNEMFLAFTADGAGAGSASITIAHTSRADAQAIVIHDGADGARLACIDLD